MGTWKIEDPNPRRCQCVMDHQTLEEGGIAQCTSSRAPGANLFCKHCEQTHGEYWRKQHPEAYTHDKS